MDPARRSRWRSPARAAGLGGALIALAITTACASRTTSTTGAVAPGSADSSILSPSDTSTTSPGGSGASSELAAPTPTPTGSPTTADANAPITCSATVSNPTPKRGSPTHVIVQTVSGAQVSLAASSRAATMSMSMSMPQHAINADADGRADLTVSSQAAGTKVNVEVQATKAGASAACSTSFTPVDLPQATGSPGLPPIQITTQPIPPANDNA